MSGLPYTELLAARVARPVRGSDGVIGRLKLLLFDYLSIVSAGARSGSASAASRAVLAEGETGPSVIEGSGLRVGPQQAALANGIAAHGLELDDTHEPSSTHPGVVVWPALFALADQEESDVSAVLESAIVGYDVIAAAGTLLGAAESYERGFHPTAVVGAIGAAAACAHLLELTREESRNALAVAADLAGGSLEFLSDGSWTKRLNAGAAAATGVRAARFGQAGFVAPATAIEGRDGWLRLYGHGSVPGRAIDLEDGAGVLGTSVKLYACCRYMHGAIDLLRAIHSDFPALSADDVESIDIGVIEAGQALVSLPPARKLVVETPVDAQFNMPFGAAVALTRGRPRLADFENAPALAKELEEWLPKVHSHTSPVIESAFPETWQAEVAVRLRSGQTIERFCPAFTGSPALPPSWAEMREKASELIGEEHAVELERTIVSLEPGKALSGQLGRIREVLRG